MTMPERLPRRLRALLRARKQQSAVTPPSRVHVARFDRTHRAWIPPDPPRRWFEGQGIEPAAPDTRRRWFS